MTKEEAFENIQSLVRRFDEQKASYKDHAYNEAQTRQDFINPFWKALGWDIDNEKGWAESYREVVYEGSLNVGGATKAPDYSFRLSGGKRLFFLEAKKPSVAIKDGAQPAYQIRRYGWSAKLPVSIISNFAEFAVYDCTGKPRQTDSASTGRIKYLTYSDYLAEFDFIWDTFSNGNVLKGSFDKYVLGDTNKKGTTTVDQDFLCSLDAWRVELARNIALRNEISEEELNFVVQHIIDRIVFLRIAEDRSVEPYGELQNAVQSGDPYKNLLWRFHVADTKYNAGLFDFKKDAISDRIAIDGKVIRGIISELYYPVCPYAFSVLSAEILGSAYEQFLGKQITLSKGGRATIAEKPEVRKAGGVYYTPQHIVEYIVANTVGKLTEGKTPGEVSAIKVVDPACGSGSFLIGAYQYLLDWHKDYYTQCGKQQRGKKESPLTPAGELTTAEKKRILLNNIYGVDLDSNAVEVTKLSLLLKCMEGETKETIEAQQQLFKDRVLPSLDDNIKSGNSLIGLDYYDNELDFGEERKVKPFSWEKNFPGVFKRETVAAPKGNPRQATQPATSRTRSALDYALDLDEDVDMVFEPPAPYVTRGGFDCVIGNPPYGARFGNNETAYFHANYKLQSYQLDSYFLFLERAFAVLKHNGLLGFIIPNTWLLNLKTSRIRAFLFSSASLESIVHYQKPVFTQTVVDTEIVIFRNQPPRENHAFKINIVTKQNETIRSRMEQRVWRELKGAPVNIFDTAENQAIKEKARKFPLLDAMCKITQGAKPFQVGKGIPKQTKKIVAEKPFVSATKSNASFKPLLRGSLMNRYQINWDRNYWIQFGDWLAEPRHSAHYFAKEKIIVRQTGDHLCATLDTEQFIVRDNLYTILPKEENVKLKYVLGLINSSFLNWYYQNVINFEKGEALAQVKRGHLAQLPIAQATEKQEAAIIKHVDQLLQLNRDLHAATVPGRIEQIQARIDYCENRINALVYELYGLTEEEITIVENVFNQQ